MTPPVATITPAPNQPSPDSLPGSFPLPTPAAPAAPAAPATPANVIDEYKERMAALEVAVLKLTNQNQGYPLYATKAPKCYAELSRPNPADSEFLEETVGVGLDWQVKYTTIYNYMSPDDLFALPQSRQTRLDRERADFTARLFSETFEVKQFGAANSDLYFIRYAPTAARKLPLTPYFSQYSHSSATISSRLLYTPIEVGALTTFLVAFYNTLWPGCILSSGHKCFLTAVLSGGFGIIGEMDKRYFYITDGCLWDTEECRFVDPTTLPALPNVFYRVFDSTYTSGDEVTVPSPTASSTPENDPLLSRTQEVYSMILKRLNNPPSDPNDYMHNPIIASWACNRPRVYQDILYMYANTFMKHKQLGAWFLEGTSRNGKSQICHFVKIMAYHPNNNTGEREWQYINHGDLQVGDYVLSWEGKPTKVTHLWPEKSKPCYRITLSDGRTVECSNTHEWAVVPKRRLGGHRPRVRDEHGRTTNKRYTIPIKRYDPDMWEIMTTEDMAKDYKSPDVSKEGWRRVNAKYYIPPAHPAELPEQELPIDPYVLGLIIGDAHIASDGSVRMSGMDSELIRTVVGREPYIEGVKTAKSKADVTNYAGNTVAYRARLIALGLNGKHSWEKVIPGQYLIGSIAQRQALLAGLLDTDGYISHGKVCSKNNQVEFSTTSKTLAEQVRSLVFSLGGSATIHERMGKYRLPDGSYKATRSNYRLFIRTLDNPFRLPRKANCWHPQRWLGYTAITNIEYIGDLPCQCITVDDYYHLYQVTENYIPTHNCSVALLRSLVGTNNCSQVPLASMGDYHFFHSLSRTLLNCPDETRSESMAADTQTFRIVASHSSMEMSKMYSQVSSQVLCDFVSVFPINHTPQWGGEEAQACLRRTLVIPYEADFSQEETPTVPFGQTNFTPEFMYDLLGEVLAYATYFRHHRWTPSNEMQSEASAIALLNDPQTAFFKQFITYFDGFQTFELLNKEFKNWCLANGVDYDESHDKINSRQMRWRQFVPHTVSINGKNLKAYCLPNIAAPRVLLADKKYQFFLDKSNKRYLNGRTVSEFLNAPYPLSVIYDFTEYQKYVHSHAATNFDRDLKTNRPYKPTDPEHPCHLRPNTVAIAERAIAAAEKEREAQRRQQAEEQYQADLAALKARTAASNASNTPSTPNTLNTPQVASEPAEIPSASKTIHIPISTLDGPSSTPSSIETTNEEEPWSDNPPPTPAQSRPPS